MTKNNKKGADRQQYTIYLDRNLLEQIKRQCKDTGISVNTYLEKFMGELQGYQTPAATIRNHVRVIELYIDAELEAAQVEFDNLGAEKVLNDYRSVEKKEDLRLLHENSLKKLTKFRNMKKSIDIIVDRLDYL